MEETNLDSTDINSLSMFNNLERLVFDDTKVTGEQVVLTDDENNTLFRNDTLLQKIICRYPEEAKSNGYQVLDSTGKIINENESLILEAFTEASIQARLYKKAYLVFEDQRETKIELTSSSSLKGYRILFDLQLEGNFYKYNNDERIHISKTFIFIGSRTYMKEVTIDNPLYSDSILQGIYSAFQKFSDSNKIAYYILMNLSYLCFSKDGLGGMMADKKGQNVILDRLLNINLHRSVTRMLGIDKSNEKLEFLSQSVTGAKDLKDSIKETLVAVSDYPVEQLFETSLNQSLGSGVSNQLIARMLWAKRIVNWILKHWYSHYIRLFKTLYNDSIKINIPFNVELTQLEQAELEKMGAERIKVLIESGVITVSEARTGYKGSKYTLNVVLDEEAFLEASKIDNPPESNQQRQEKALRKDDKTIKVKPTEAEQTDALDNSFWDAMAETTEVDLIEVAESVLKK